MIWREPGTRALSGAKHCRKRPLQRWPVTYLGRDSNEWPNRPLRVRWGFRHSCPISLRNPTPSCAAFYCCNGYRRDIYGDNARPHRARLVRSYLESETIPQMTWPATSPDLNPIKHVGKTDCRSHCASRHPPRAATSLVTRIGITTTTSDQRYYCQRASSLSSIHFS
ncbi:hypothetical protein AVEN_59316-1 [Araneus ventricosus]|uniref:Tc1-like transposase DDE domain-containing protein n=1 Tax=Araneus ventricosus TaxID=182803 RepID=A0A4Y2QD41_ARAVE|nr:hypothetical protein AVEN_59316-1 [Araneus ventricosus]